MWSSNIRKRIHQKAKREMHFFLTFTAILFTLLKLNVLIRVVKSAIKCCISHASNWMAANEIHHFADTLEMKFACFSIPCNHVISINKEFLKKFHSSFYILCDIYHNSERFAPKKTLVLFLSSECHTLMHVTWLRFLANNVSNKWEKEQKLHRI